MSANPELWSLDPNIHDWSTTGKLTRPQKQFFFSLVWRSRLFNVDFAEGAHCFAWPCKLAARQAQTDLVEETCLGSRTDDARRQPQPQPKRSAKISSCLASRSVS
mmetsp:Transcript_74504/g.155312  ORF Transcript_74504/g.155312 Transcript_74504/m.155312 type:complete len:105 (+) Transcript_74504:412-726(+)